MVKEEKIKRLLELCGVNKGLVEIANTFIPSKTTEDTKFVDFLYEKLVDEHTKIFMEKFPEDKIDDLISFFSNQDLQKSLALFNQLSSEALNVCDVEVMKYIEEEDIEDYVEREADKGEVN